MPEFPLGRMPLFFTEASLILVRSALPERSFIVQLFGTRVFFFERGRVFPNDTLGHASPGSPLGHDRPLRFLINTHPAIHHCFLPQYPAPADNAELRQQPLWSRPLCSKGPINVIFFVDWYMCLESLPSTENGCFENCNTNCSYGGHEYFV